MSTARATLGEPCHLEDNGAPGVVATLGIGGNSHRIWYRVRGASSETRLEPFLIAALLPAMAVGVQLEARGTASRRLLDAFPRVQDIFTAWDLNLQRVRVHVDAAPTPAPATARGIGCFFSGGVDSWYSALKHETELSALVFVHGFDVPLDNMVLRDKVTERIRAAARQLGKPLIEVETNVREVSGQYVSWDLLHGAALASVAQLLSSRFHTLYIPAALHFAHLIPNGTHPVLDPLWSTEATDILDDGCEVTKMDKIARVATSDVALGSLRVCWLNTNGAYNCGRCGKCLQTMAGLRLVGALGRCSTFEHPLDLRAMARIAAVRPFRRYRLENILEWAQRAGDRALARALRDCLSRKYERGVWRMGERGFRRLAGGARRRIGLLLRRLQRLTNGMRGLGAGRPLAGPGGEDVL